MDDLVKLCNFSHLPNYAPFNYVRWRNMSLIVIFGD